MTEQTLETNEDELTAQLEALLFVASNPVPVLQLAETLGCSGQEIERGLKMLGSIYDARRGLSLQWHGGRVQLTTAPAYGPLVERFLGLEATTRLSRAALETLAIVAYRQPITRPGIDAIRGVNSDGVLKSLLSKGLLQEVGRTEGPGRPILYGTSSEFLQHFGLSALDKLPPFEILQDIEPAPRNEILKD
jgi:segregation and condensation protein B